MLEIIIFLGVLGAIGERAHQRGVGKMPYVIGAGVGFVMLLLLSATVLGPLGLLLRWLWVGGVYMFLEHGSSGGLKVEESWRCPDCTMFNDAVTLRCLCGYIHEDAREVVDATEAPEPESVEQPMVGAERAAGSPEWPRQTTVEEMPDGHEP